MSYCLRTAPPRVVWMPERAHASRIHARQAKTTREIEATAGQPVIAITTVRTLTPKASGYPARGRGPRLQVRAST